MLAVASKEGIFCAGPLHNFYRYARRRVTFEPGFQQWNPGHFMKKQVAILVDAEWFRKVLTSALFPRTPAIGATPAIRRVAITAEQFYRNACNAHHARSHRHRSAARHSRA